MSVYRRNKAWTYSIELGRDEHGKRKKIYEHGFRTKREATEAKAKRQAELLGGRSVDPSKMTLRQYLRHEWLPYKKPSALVRKEQAKTLGVDLDIIELDAMGIPAEEQPGRVRVSTYKDYDTSCRLHIEPAIGTIRLQKIRGKNIEDMLRTLGDKGLSQKSLHNIYGVLNRAFEDAVRWEFINRNPCQSVDRPSKGISKFDLWTLDELRSFLRAISDHPYRAGFLVVVGTGMRRGEVAGLTWPNIDLEDASLTARWQLAHPGGKQMWGPVKTKKGARRISLDAMTVAALKEWRARQAAMRLAAGPAWVEVNVDEFGQGMRDVVFTHADGTMIAPNRWRIWLHKICVDAGIRPVSVHAIRHTYATLGLKAATSLADMKQLSTRLGHASMAFTLDKYADALPEGDRELADDIAGLWQGTGTVEDLRAHKRRRDEGDEGEEEGPNG